MQHFTVDARNITKDQFDALKAAAEAAGMYTRFWFWGDREQYPFVTTKTLLGNPAMRAWWDDFDPELVTYPEAMRRLAETAEPSKEQGNEAKAHPHAENMRLYAEDAAETDRPWERWEIFACFGWDTMARHPKWNPDSNYRRKPKPQKTPVQEAGFEVGDLAVTTYEDSTPAGCIVRLSRDDGTPAPVWRMIDGKSEFAGDCEECIRLARVRKLHNVREA